jgi:hypothetical protein
MSKPNNSTTYRRNIDISQHIDEITACAIEDSAKTGNLYTVQEYTREIMSAFCKIRRHQRELQLQLQTPTQIAETIISTEMYLIPEM